MTKKIELELTMTTILTIAGVVGVALGAVRWVTKAEVSHDEVVVHEQQIEKLDQIVDELHQQQKLERELWGESYRERIHEVLTNEEQ
tara:strand:- start:29228 stop:29488 length:261 start_codon:yes stop_codon:yes gene_type:complete